MLKAGRFFRLNIMALLDLITTYHRPLAAVGIFSVIYYILSSIYLRWQQYQLARANRCEPVVGKIPTYDPLFGLDRIYRVHQLAQERTILHNSAKRFEDLGNTHRGQRFATPIVLTIEPQNVKTVLSLKFGDFSMGDRLQTFGPLLGHGIFTSDGEDWARSRQMVRPNFVKDQVAHLEVFEEMMEDLFALIPGDGRTVDLQDLFFSFTIDSATEFLTGHNVHSLKKRRAGEVNDGLDFAKAFDYALADIATNNRFGPLMFLNRDAKAVEARRVCREMVDQFVDKAMEMRNEKSDETSERRYMFLYGLAQHTDDRSRIRDELMNLLLAGRDTTASLLGGMFFMLAKHQNAWAKLQAEIATLDGKPPTFEQLQGLKYVRYCINESKFPFI